MWCYEECDVKEALTPEKYIIINLLLDKVDEYLWKQNNEEETE